MTFVMENCLLDLFVVLDLDLQPKKRITSIKFLHLFTNYI